MAQIDRQTQEAMHVAVHDGFDACVRACMGVTFYGAGKLSKAKTMEQLAEAQGQIRRLVKLVKKS